MLPAGSWGWCWERSPWQFVLDGLRQAVRASADGARQVRRKARSQTSWPRRSPRRSKRVGARSAERGTKAPSAARFSSSGVAIRVESISSAYGCQSVARRKHAAVREAAHRQVDERTLDQTPLVVALSSARDPETAPGSRARSAGRSAARRPRPRRDRMTRTFASPRSSSPSSSRPTPGAMDLDAQEIPPGMRGREATAGSRRCRSRSRWCTGRRARTAAWVSSGCVPNATPYFGHSEGECTLLRCRDPARRGSRRSGSSVGCSVRGHLLSGSYSVAGASPARPGRDGRAPARSWYKRARCGSGPRHRGSQAMSRVVVGRHHRPGGLRAGVAFAQERAHAEEASHAVEQSARAGEQPGAGLYERLCRIDIRGEKKDQWMRLPNAESSVTQHRLKRRRQVLRLHRHRRHADHPRRRGQADRQHGLHRLRATRSQGQRRAGR